MEDQQRADERIAELVGIPNVDRYLSVEPMLGPIRIEDWHLRGLDWVVIGCESGRGRRSCRHEWMIEVVEQCRAASVPVFVKQVEVAGVATTDIAKFPGPLRARELPNYSGEAGEGE